MSSILESTRPDLPASCGLGAGAGPAVSGWSWGHAPRPSPCRGGGRLSPQSRQALWPGRGACGSPRCLLRGSEVPESLRAETHARCGSKAGAQLSTRTAGPRPPPERSQRPALHRPPGRGPSGLEEVGTGAGGGSAGGRGSPLLGPGRTGPLGPRWLVAQPLVRPQRPGKEVGDRRLL